MASLFQSRWTEVNEEPFKDLIQRDPDICNNCFRRTHDTYERNFVVDTYREDGETKLWAREVDLTPRSWPRPDEVGYVHGELPSEGTYLTCKCGSNIAIRPVSFETAFEHVTRLRDRLEEKEVDFDEDVMFTRARELLREPKWQGKQDDVFGKIIEVALNGRLERR